MTDTQTTRKIARRAIVCVAALGTAAVLGYALAAPLCGRSPLPSTAKQDSVTPAPETSAAAPPPPEVQSVLLIPTVTIVGSVGAHAAKQ